jgi:hypothetical protein
MYLASASTQTEKSHATCRKATGLLHSAGSSSAVRAALSFDDEHFAGVSSALLGAETEQPPSYPEPRLCGPLGADGASYTAHLNPMT